MATQDMIMPAERYTTSDLLHFTTARAVHNHHREAPNAHGGLHAITQALAAVADPDAYGTAGMYVATLERLRRS